MNVLPHSATELVGLYRRKQLSPVEAWQASIDAVHAHNSVINAFQHVDEEASFDQARASESRWMRGEPLGLLDGVPCTVKDNLLTAGWPTRSGSLTVDTAGAWTEDAPAVARWRESGAVLLGKTTMPEFAWKVTTDSPLFGVTRNPWNPEVTPGGSSGGAAAATACGMGMLALATDGGGSIRVPASRCGLVGLKPTHGRVADYPPSRFGTHSNVGPITRTVADCATMMNVIAWPDTRDWYALPYDGDDFGAGLSLGVRGLRIGVSLDLGCGCAVHPEIAALISQAADVFADLGAYVEPLDFGQALYREGLEAYSVARSVMLATLLKRIPVERHASMDADLVRAAQQGESIDVARYVDAEHSRRLAGMQINRLFERYDLLFCPTIHTLAEPVYAPAPEPWLTMLFNGSRHPALSFPCGLSSDWLPIGGQLIGAHYTEALLLRAAASFEAAHPFEPLPIQRAAQ
jgi:aspartyl-tRNA(Asn)/glutamyl-tRNA(Gln) amidotransferase subunit A